MAAAEACKSCRGACAHILGDRYNRYIKVPKMRAVTLKDTAVPQQLYARWRATALDDWSSAELSERSVRYTDITF